MITRHSPSDSQVAVLRPWSGAQLALRLCITTFLFPLLLESQGVTPSATGSPRIEREIAFNAKKETDGYKLAVMRASFVREVHAEWKAHRERFFEYVPRSPEAALGAGAPQRRLLTEDQVLDRADLAAKTQLHGFDLQDSPTFEIVRDLTSLLPYGSETATSVIRHLLSTDGSGVVEYDPRWYEERAGGLLVLADDESPLATRLLRAFSEEAQFNPRNRDWSANGAVRDVKARAAALSEHQILTGKIDSLPVAELREFLRYEKERRIELERAERDQKKRRELEQKFRRDQQNVVGSIESFGYALQLLGDAKGADRIFTVARITNTIMEMNRPGAELATGALVSGYMGAAVAAVSLFSSGGDGSQEMMQAILEAVNVLREEMHARFEAIDAGMAAQMAVTLEKTADISRSLADLQTKSLVLDSLVKRSRAEVRVDLEAQRERGYLAEKDKCLNYSGTAREPTATEHGDCIRVFNQWANDFSMGADLANDEISFLSGVEPPLVPYAANVQSIARSTITYGASDLARMMAPDRRIVDRTRTTVRSGLYVPNPAQWLKSADDLLSLLRLAPDARVAAGTALENLELTGALIQRLYTSLMFDKDRRVRVGVFRNLLVDLSLNSGFVYEIARSYAETRANDRSDLTAVQPQIDLGRYHEQLPNYTPLYFFARKLGASQNLKWCGQGRPLRVGAAVQDPVRQGVTIDDRTHPFIPDEVKLYDWLQLGRIEFCLVEMSLPQIGPMTPNGRLRIVHYDATVRVRFVSAVDSGAVHDVVELRVADRVEIRHALKHPQNWVDMIWTWPLHLGPQATAAKLSGRGAMPVREALTRPEKVKVKDLFVPAQFAQLRSVADARLNALRAKRIGLARSESAGLKAAAARIEELRELMLALYSIGLRAAMSNEERQAFVRALGPTSGILDDGAMISFAFYGSRNEEPAANLTPLPYDPRDGVDVAAKYVSFMNQLKLTGAVPSELASTTRSAPLRANDVVRRTARVACPEETIDHASGNARTSQTAASSAQPGPAKVDEECVPARTAVAESVEALLRLLHEFDGRRPVPGGHPLVESTLDQIRQHRPTITREP